jgi:selenocysteine-specific elongation factor
MLGTAGHVDHGKTALVKLLTGCETDTLAEEKQRGLTIDLGFAPCRLPDERIVGIVDVPGHVDFIRNMVAGAQGIDVVIFVVAADDGIMPQTREHLQILALMGLRHGLVALNKIDLVEPARREAVAADMRRLLAGTFLAEAPVCPVSAVTGEGFDGFFRTLHEVVQRCGDRSGAGVFRVWVEDMFTVRGAGTVITGIPVAGVVRAGDELALLPGDATGRVRRLQVYGADATEGRAGECVALNIPEIDHLSVRRGRLLAPAGALAPVTMAEAELQILPTVKCPVEDYLEVHLHVGTAAVTANVAMLEQTEMAAGQRQLVQLRLAEPLPLAAGDRFVLRANLSWPGHSGLTTIGGGRILGTGNVRLRRKKQWTLEGLAARRDALGDPARWAELMLRERGAPMTPGELQCACLARPEETARLLEQLRAAGQALPAGGGAFVHAAAVQAAAAKARAALQEFHAANPQRAGLTREELLTLAGVDATVLDLALASLLAARQIERTGTGFAQAGWSARLPDRDQRLSEQVAEIFQKAGWIAPTLAEVATALREPPPRVEKVARLLVERGVLVRLDERLHVHRDAVGAAQEVALRLFGRAPRFTTMEFRDALAVSRKYAVPLLDHLDRIRFTARNGHDRTPGVEARRRLALAPPPNDES